MDSTIQMLLDGKSENHVMPFFWQHGEDEALLRQYVHVIHDANCGAFCVESRPHPDFCGPRWWHDMDAILDEAQKLGMKVWILDDSHFPTGYANGAVKTAPQELCRQSIVAYKGKRFSPKFRPNNAERFIIKRNERTYTDDKILSVSHGWTVGLTRKLGFHPEYINMLDARSVRLLIDAVYEKHWEHYHDLFGTVIAGFFSDEPELGNYHIFEWNLKLGRKDLDLPFSDEVAAALERSLGQNWEDQMYLLWENRADPIKTKKVRLAYMDAVTNTLKQTFSFQIGDWCRAHGVAYMGHMIEDNGCHARTGSGLGHYFRGLAGQDYAGIDDIGGQVYPQGEDDHKGSLPTMPRNSDFYHFMLGRLASSAAAIEPLKNGRAMCEIFGNYGWQEGVYLEKYLADHFMVRGINNFVPHAFSPKAFPDPDCPPHFYAQGHNPQYRHFAALIAYINRVCTLLSCGERMASAALVYHAEAEWQGDNFVPNEQMARKLEQAQISFDIVPRDYFEHSEDFAKRNYEAVIDCKATEVPASLKPEAVFSPASIHLRVCHIHAQHEIYYFVNEAAETWRGSIKVDESGAYYAYNAWENRVETIDLSRVELEPRKSLIVIFDDAAPAIPYSPLQAADGVELPIAGWKRAVCEGASYPHWQDEKEICLPDNLAQEKPDFSGFVCYRASFDAEQIGHYLLVLENAAEGVEVFVNDTSIGIQIVPPFSFDLSNTIRMGHNELRIEVATTLERECYSLKKGKEKLFLPRPKSESGITGPCKLYFVNETEERKNEKAGI